jgi:hypothetical protein
MIMVISFGAAGPQNPIYGIHHDNISDRLTQRNWCAKAIVRSDIAGWLYLWVARGTYQNDAGRKVSAYFIKVHPGTPRERALYYEAEFQYLTDALRYINGEDDGLLARETTPALPGAAYPAEQGAPIYIGFGRPRVIIPRG